MKKALLLIMILLVALCVVACGGSDNTTSTTAASTSGNAVTTTAADGTTNNTVVTTDGTVTTTAGVVSTAISTPEGTPTVTTAPAGELLETEDYTAVLNGNEWVKSEVDTSKYDMFGTGASLINQIGSTYNGYKKTYYTLDENGEKVESSATAIKRLSIVGAMITADKSAKTCEAVISPVEFMIQPSWTSVTAKAGTYLMFEFTCNIPLDFTTTVTAKEGGASSSAAYKQDGISVSGGNGTYKGIAKCTVPYAAGQTMYINICLSGSAATPVISIPVNITTMKYDSDYKLVFQGDWEMIKHEDYLSNLVDLFYNVYPRLYARFGNGSEPKTITFMADKNYEGVAYNAGTLVCVATDYANSNPNDIGFFAHEITHAVQQYGGKMHYDATSTYKDPETGKVYSVNAWWTEFMADLGRFRYFHWGYSSKYCKFYSMTDPSIRDFGYQSYGQHNIFSAYIDDVYGTRKNDDGTVTLGLMDAVNELIKDTKTLLTDNPYDPTIPFNQVVKKVTGHDTLEEVRLEFVKALDDGTWAFKGYRNYQDNFQTEDLPGIPNPEYPMNEPVAKGDKTAPVLGTPVTEGTNLALGAAMVSTSGAGGGKNVFDNMFDGDLTTKWQAATPKDDYKYQLGGFKHEFVIDLGAVKTFDTYTIVNASNNKENKTFNTREWEIFVSEDGTNWTSVDYQKDNTEGIVSVNVGDTSARYVKVRLFATDASSVGTARIYEFMLFDQQ